MSALSIPPEFDSLSPAEQVAYLRAVWQRIDRKDEAAAQEASFQESERVADSLEADPTQGQPWVDMRGPLQAEFEARFGKKR